MRTVLKDPATAVQVSVAFVGIVTSLTSVDVARYGYVPGSADLQVQHAVGVSTVQLTLDGGADGELYTLNIRAAINDGDEAEQQLSIFCLGRDWSMSGTGDQGWLTTHEFIDRFGLDETISATASDAGGALDRAFLVAKLQDAQAEAEANIGTKYALPLAQVPAILKTVVADLGRARLYRRGVPDEVAENAKVQRRILERISTGSLNLPVSSGSVAQAVESDIPVSGWSGGSAYPDKLVGY
jgi:phage gp36-like protein